MKRLIQIFVVVSLMLALAPAAAFAHTADGPLVTDLIAGGGNEASGTDVGDVLVWNDGDYLYVKYVTADGWCITETHVAGATSPENIPGNNGNPTPGQFEYADEHDCVAGVEYQIALAGDWTIGASVFVAAHAVVQTGGLDGLEVTLPDQVTIDVTYPGLDFGMPSYFDVVVSGGTMLDGTYDGNCVELEGGPPSGTANVYSSYEELPPGVIKHPENLDLVNWIINQGFVGQPSGCGGAYTFGDVQWAVWKLVDGRDPTPGALSSLRDWSPCRAQEILDLAIANGEGYVPGCGEVMDIILAPEVSWTQSVMIWVPVPCAQEETAWSDGLPFSGKNWATYFEYEIQ